MIRLKGGGARLRTFYFLVYVMVNFTFIRVERKNKKYINDKIKSLGRDSKLLTFLLMYLLILLSNRFHQPRQSFGAGKRRIGITTAAAEKGEPVAAGIFA